MQKKFKYVIIFSVIIMYVIGLIAEYNPFHNGHLYQIKKIKEKYPDSIIIGVISLVIFVISLLFDAFLFNPIELGCNRFFYI